MNKSILKTPRYLAQYAESSQLRKDDIDSIYPVFTNENNQDSIWNRAKFELFLAFRRDENLLDVSLLAKSTQLSEKLIEELFTNEIRITTFPIVNNKGAKLAKSLVVELSAGMGIHSFTTNSEQSQALDIIHKATKKDFFVLFNDVFVDSSFMLAVTAGLLARTSELSKYAFSGEVSELGDVLPINSAQKKTRTL